MTDDDRVTHAQLADQLSATIHRLSEDLASRTDPLLSEVAHALELVLDLTRHAHDHALENRDRITAIEARLAGPAGAAGAAD